MSTGTILYAQVAEEPKGGDNKDQGPPGWSPLILMALLAAMFYFFLIVPNRRERQRQQQILAGLKKNDEVQTSSGILGVVTNIKENGDEVTIRSDETRLRVLKSSIVRIINVKPDASGGPAQDQAVVDLTKKGKA